MDKKLFAGIVLSITFTGLVVYSVSAHERLKEWQKTAEDISNIIKKVETDLEFQNIVDNYEE